MEDLNDFEQLSAGYALGNLSEEELARFRQAVERNPELGIEADRLKDVLDLLPYGLPDASDELPTSRMREAILRQVESPVLHPQTPTVSNVIPFRSTATAWVAAGLLIALTGGLGWNTVRLVGENRSLVASLDRERDLIAMLQRSDARLISLKGMDQAVRADGSLLINSGDSTGILTVRDLPPLPADRVYQVWLVLDGRKIESGKFTVGADGRAVAKIQSLGFTQNSDLMVTIEPKGGMDSPTGPMVMTSRA